MTEEQQGEQEPRGGEPLAPEVADPMLDTFVELADAGLGVSLTLTLPGGVVTGMLVGRTQWLGLFREALTATGETGAAIGSQIEQAWLKRMDDEDTTLPYGFVHLQGAKFLLGSSQHSLVPHNEGLLWRGRLSEVSGWSLGGVEPA